MIKIIICGVSGRMGKELIKASNHDSRFKLAGGIVRNPTLFDLDLGEIAEIPKIGVYASLDLVKIINECDVVIDFSLPESSMNFAAITAQHKKIYVTGVTGYSEEQLDFIKQLASEIAIFQSYNMSLGINVMMKLASLAAKFLPKYNIDLIDIHHKQKLDTPSGTAKMIISAVKRGNPHSDIITNSLRIGDFFGEHQLRFSGGFETISITHQAQSRSIFATGALEACLWAAKQPAGFYIMDDMLK